MDWHRTLSTIVACLYVGAALFALLSHPSADAVLILLMACLFVAAALAMIWYGEDWGGPSVGVSAPGIDRGNPGLFRRPGRLAPFAHPGVGRHSLLACPLKKSGAVWREEKPVSRVWRSPTRGAAHRDQAAAHRELAWPGGCLWKADPRRLIASAAATAELN